MWPPRSAAFPLAVRFPHPFMARVAVLDGAVHARRVHGGGHNHDQSDRPEDEPHEEGHDPARLPAKRTNRLIGAIKVVMRAT